MIAGMTRPATQHRFAAARTRTAGGHVVEELEYAVEAWTDDGGSLVEVLARACQLHIATGAYWAATRARPKTYVTLRQGAYVLRERRPGGPA